MKRLIQTQIESDSQKLETATDVKFQTSFTITGMEKKQSPKISK